MIDERAKPWSDKLRKTGKNTHGQTWEDIFGPPQPEQKKKPKKEKKDND